MNQHLSALYVASHAAHEAWTVAIKQRREAREYLSRHAEHYIDQLAMVDAPQADIEITLVCMREARAAVAEALALVEAANAACDAARARIEAAEQVVSGPVGEDYLREWVAA